MATFPLFTLSLDIITKKNKQKKQQKTQLIFHFFMLFDLVLNFETQTMSQIVELI